MFWRSHRAISEKKEADSQARPLLVLGIHSSGIKALIVTFNKGEVNVLSAVEEPFNSVQFVTDKLVDINGIFERVIKSVRHAERIAKLKVKQFIVSTSGTIVKSGSQTLGFRREDPNKKLDIAELTYIVQKLEEKAIGKDRRRFTLNQGIQEKDLKLLHASLLSMRLDGKKSVNPLGLPARHVECSFYNSFVHASHSGILKTLASELDLELLGVVPDIVGISTLMPIISPGIDHGFIVDVGAASTTIGVVKDGALLDTVAFNIGGDSFSKRLMYTLHTNLADAEKIKRAYSASDLETHSHQTIYDALKFDVQIWLDAVNHSIKDLIKRTRLKDEDIPTTIAMSGGGTRLPELTQALLSVDWQHDIDFTERAKIEHLQLKRVHVPFLKTNGQITDSRFISLLGVSILGRDFIAQQNLMQTVLQKALRLISV